jgi:hypothetical protein
MTPRDAPRTVHFDIGRITLPGYSPGQQARFVSSLQTQLAGLADLADLAGLAGLAASDGRGWPAGAPPRIGHLDAGVLRPGAAPEEAAARIAAALLAAVGGPETRAGQRDG